MKVKDAKKQIDKISKVAKEINKMAALSHDVKEQITTMAGFNMGIDEIIEIVVASLQDNKAVLTEKIDNAEID